MGLKKTIAVSVLAVTFGVVAVPVYGQFQLQGFFNPSEKYRQWFDQNTSRRGFLRVSEISQAPTVSIATKYPYPDKAFVMTEEFWNQSSSAIVGGKSDWFDTEIIRQRAEVEEYPPAMDFLAWMYQEGRGVNRDYRKAFMWYERAKLAGFENSRGSSEKIFDRLSISERATAERQLGEDIEQYEAKIARKEGLSGYSSTDFNRIKLHILRQQNDFNFFKNKRNADGKRKPSARR